MRIRTLILVLFMSATYLLNAETEKKPTNAMLYSAFIPGGGQIYNGKYIKAGIVIGVQSYLITSAIYHIDKKDEYNRKASSATTINDRLYYESKRDGFRDMERNDYWWIAITALLSIADAFVDAHLSDFQAQRDKVHLRFDDQMMMFEYSF